MKGAAAELVRSTRTPIASRQSSMGASHHFLLCMRKAVNSPIRDGVRCSARAWKSDGEDVEDSVSGGCDMETLTRGLKLPEVSIGIVGRLAFLPVARRGSVEMSLKRVPSGKLHDDSHGSQ